MDLRIRQSKLSGTIEIPPSKSYSHRHLIMAILSKKKSWIPFINDGDDIQATINVGQYLGCRFEKKEDGLFVDSENLFTLNNEVVDVYASGSTLRFFIPICLLKEGVHRFYMRDRLKDRSLKVYEDIFKNCQFKKEGNILEIQGTLTSGVYEVDGSHSSQFLSGLFFALPLLKKDSEIIITGKLVSQDYLKMTLHCLKEAGIHIEMKDERHYIIKGNQTYQYDGCLVESDASGATFIKVAKYLGQDVQCQMTETHFQADAKIDEFLESIKDGKGCIDVSDCPDLTPPLALAMALTPGHFEIVGAGRLVDKESNRLEAICDVLNRLGACIEIKDEGLVICGVPFLNGGKVDSYQDHRIAMMAVIGALVAKDEVIVTNAQCVSKSWPNFYRQLKEIGGVIDEL